MSGTSMASPHVAGAAALLWSAAPSLIGDVDTTESLLVQWSPPRTSGQSCGGTPGDQVPNNIYGWGRLDAFKTVQAAVRNTTLQMSAVNEGNHAIKIGAWDLAGAFNGFTTIGGSSSHFPALTAFLNRHYLAVKGNTNNSIYLRYRNDQGIWNSWSTLPGATSTSPALASFNNKLYLIVKGAVNNSLYLLSMDGSETWDTSWTTLSGQTAEAPALIVFNTGYTYLSKGQATPTSITGRWTPREPGTPAGPSFPGGRTTRRPFGLQ